MKKTRVTARAIKRMLVDLASDDKLPLDMNDLDVDLIENVLKENEPTKEDKVIEEASHYLVEGEFTFAEQVEKIAKWPEQFDQIDYVDGVIVWQAVENQFTCDAFLDLIGYKM